MPISSKPPRSPWAAFPDVLIHASESMVKQSAHYGAAKAGDDRAAARLVDETLNPAQVEALRQLAGNATPTLVSAHALEREGVNAIPEVFADRLGALLGWPVDSVIVQINLVSYTGANGFWRLARQAGFDGPVVAGQQYVLVDDFVGMGGTLANLKGHIESNGGGVLAAVCLTGKHHSAKLAPSTERLAELRNKHGKELETWWLRHFAHAFDALTESEARYLARTETADTVRDRIAAAE
jgi:hypothetical protein